MNRKVRSRVRKLNKDIRKLMDKAHNDIKKIDDGYEIYNNGNIYVNHFTHKEVNGSHINGEYVY